ncbi:MAG: sulfotransferase family 2 domain-containing protein [Pseudomonadota bacterium]
MSGLARQILTHLCQALYASQGRRRCPQRVCFLHIQKTAGSAVNGYFKGLLGPYWQGQAVTVPDAPKVADLSLAKNARFVGGHYAAPSLARFRGDAYTFTFLRDPLDRMVSAWRFYQAHADPALPLPHATLEEALADGSEAVMSRFDNPMVRQLAVSASATPATALARQDWVETALTTLRSFDRVGRQESFDRDFRAILDDLGLPQPDTVARRNVTDDPERKTMGAKPPPAPPREVLAPIAEPYIALDRQLIAAWERESAQ